MTVKARSGDTRQTTRMTRVAQKLLALLIPLSAAALAGGLDGPRFNSSSLPTVSVNAAPVGRITRLGHVPLAVRTDAPVFFFPAHVRAVLNRPGESWRAAYDVDQPPAYVGVYPVAGVNAQYPERQPHTVDLLVKSRLNALQGILSGTVDPKGLPVPLPYFPLPNAYQVTAGAVKKVVTKDLIGLRFLTIHSQEGGVRFPREVVEYTFQGLTRDGKYLVTVHLPYGPASLPTRTELERLNAWIEAPFPGSETGPDAVLFRKANAAYLAGLLRKLNAESGRLYDFDAVVLSIGIH